MTDDISSKKAAERKRIIEQRKKISPIKKKQWDEQICKNFFELSGFEGYSCILCYRSLPGEVDTVGIADMLIEKGKRLFLPKTYSDGKMVFYEVGKDTKLVCGNMGVYEPMGDTEIFEGESALCVVPGLCFDKNGARLGYGAGFYDRYLYGRDLKKTALAYGCFIKPQVLHSQYDVRMDSIITQYGIIDCAEKSE